MREVITVVLSGLMIAMLVHATVAYLRLRAVNRVTRRMLHGPYAPLGERAYRAGLKRLRADEGN